MSKRKAPEALFLSLMLTALLVLTGLPTTALAQDSGASFDNAPGVVIDTEEQSDEKDSTLLESETLDALGLTNSHGGDGATGVLGTIQQHNNADLQANRPFDSATEKFVFEVKVVDDATEKCLSFFLPVLGGGYGRPYDWNIDWGDGVVETKSGTGTPGGIEHIYSAGGTYAITITIAPNGSEAAWLAAFGFGNGFLTEDTYQRNRNKVVKVVSPITPAMTRDVNSSIVPNNEWNNTFSYCTNLTMGKDFTFSEEWNSITAVGDNFARNMFSSCSNDSFTMNDVFNLPQNLTSVGDDFASGIFAHCKGSSFTMNDVFNLPQNLVNVGDRFANSMFYSCQGTSFAMNNVFNLPQGIVSGGDRFAREMFYFCYGDALTMNEVFTLPQSLESVGNEFAYCMFSHCYGKAFTMNAVFNLPQKLTSAGRSFAMYMFSTCNGDAFAMSDVFNLPQNFVRVGEFFTANMFNSAGGPNFQVNDAFKLPRLDSVTLNQTGVFNGTFQNLASTTSAQNRLAQDIIGDLTYVPDSARDTFAGAACFLDRPYIDVNWGGDSAPRPSITVSFDTASQGLTCTNPPGSATVGQYLAVAKPAPDPHVDGYVFDNWYTTGNFDTVWDFSNACRDAMTLYARFVPVNTPAPDPTPDPKPVPAPSPDSEPGSISESASSALSQQALARTGDATMFAGLALAGTAGFVLACMAFARAKRKAKDL